MNLILLENDKHIISVHKPEWICIKKGGENEYLEDW